MSPVPLHLQPHTSTFIRQVDVQQTPITAHHSHTPIRAQYLGVKRQHPDALVLFRMGDFFETFDEDAEIVARELEITLTKRDWGRGEKSPMSGFPHQAAESYIARLIARGHRVAVCEQMSDPALSRGLVEREVVRVVTPGTVVDPAMLVAKRNNYLAAVVLGRGAVGVAYVDVTTGEFATTQFAAADPEGALAQELARVQPAEVLMEAAERQPFSRHAGQNGASEDDTPPDADLLARLRALDSRIHTVVTPLAARAFREEVARATLCEQFAVASLAAYGCEHLPLAARAAGAIVAYLRETQRGALAQLTALETYSTAQFMTLDNHTRRNLELFESGSGGGVKGSLLWVLDHTRTPMGGRLLRRWLGEPLLDLAALRARQDAVADALADVALRARLAPALAHVGDLERLTNRVLQRIATPRDLGALAAGLRAVEQVAQEFAASPAGAPEHGLGRFAHGLGQSADVQTVVALIERALVDTPPPVLSDGGAIRPGYSAELDQIVNGARDGRQWVANLERVERERTGIPNLKVGYNKVFGYFLEVTNSHAAKVPADYIRKQTLAGAERFITPDLKEYEALILGAQEKSVKLEQELFAALRAEIATQHAERILRAARALAALDVVLALAEVASRQGYCRPELDAGDALHVIAGRHPVVELSQGDVPFVPNDVEMATHDAQILLLTGPNMAGKSTYLRQVALIVLLAQIGSFVPAEAARIGLVDRIFTRIGAQDDLATGQSTFMVEMVETANILHHATPQSLVVLDEIGRGTSTYDGLAIARAIVEYLHNNQRCGAKTLFATHYHELVELARTLPRVRACNVAVAEEEGRVVVLRKIVPGGADKSYGIHVAQLAGIPRQVVRRAEEVLEELERTGDARTRRRAMREIAVPQAVQLTLFAA
ncbi:MAG TPA: DNA mismatch repair protein MutS, partial [Ktedonobacterales bacterium]|nr:DNA mismatch repair protein MutS [Ktedonobacterales bacterium]